MKNRKTDIIISVIIICIYLSAAFSTNYLGGNTGRLISGLFIGTSLAISWKLLKGNSALVKVFGYFMNFGLFFLASAIAIEFIVGVTPGTYANIFLLVIISAVYYFFLFRKLFKK